MNQYPLWKNLLVAIALLLGVIYALPNLYGDDPSVQVMAGRTARVSTDLRDRISGLLAQNQLTPKAIEAQNQELLVRFNDTETQLKAFELVRSTFEEGNEDYTVALNLAPATPAWLRGFGAKPMYLGLDLRGGVHFLLEVDMKAAEQQALERSASDIRTLLREEKVRYLSVNQDGNQIEVKFRDTADREKALDKFQRQYRDLSFTDVERDGTPWLIGTVTPKSLLETRNFALQQNITTLRNRVNELGVTEPVIQQQGQDRIVVQLAGVQDTSRAKEILGATATLEYHMVDENADPAAALKGMVPPGSKLYLDRDGRPHVLYKEVIITGNQIIDASSGLDGQSSQPMVSVTLDANGARRMDDNTKANIGKGMAVVFIENKTETRKVDGQIQRVTRKSEQVISVATIRDRFSKRFQTTGLDTPEEARNLALLLRAGALAAPMQIVEERTVGPSLGADNITKGMDSNIYGFLAITVFMIMYYRLFGTFSVVALAGNAILLVAVLSWLQATLTLPGMAAIALTIGMAIDANVLINERIRDELRDGKTPRAAIQAGYDRAFGTILDSNITTFIAGFALLLLGSGPVRGFAVVLCIGIVTSIFSAVMVSRVLANFAYGRKARVHKLSI
jgi:preprotein translocase subunit SecD